ncbi:MAG: sigma-70 family RNA polymerase sigma factor, partial [Acidobacteriaceae bacterium]|nr:sigma-70 family RNA polymerase sigma factor [Acidobacteriaceae bacterium]
MDEALSTDGVTAEQNRRISDTVRREQARLRQFIRQRVPDTGDAEDIFQEVFYELIEAYRLMKPLEQVGAWLFRVARHRIIDLFRRQRPAVLGNDLMLASEDGETHRWEDLLPSREEGPEAAYAR